MKPTLKLQLEPREQALLGIAVVVVGAVLFVRFAFLPMVARIGERRTALHDLGVRFDSAQALVAGVPDPEQALDKARERYRILERRFGAEQSVARILETLSQQAKSHRLELVAVQPRAEEREPRLTMPGSGLSLQEVPLALTLSGRYRQLGEFLEGLSVAPFITSVQRLQITKPRSESVQLQADLSLVAYLAEPPSTP